MHEQVAIIDVGSSAIITLVGVRGVNDTLNIIGKGEISYAGFQNAEFIEPENLKFAVASSISNAEISMNDKIDEIYVGVPGEFSAVVTKNITLRFPKTKRISEFDVQNVLKTGNDFEKEKNYVPINQSTIYFSLDDHAKYIDPVGQRAQKLDGFISFVLAMKSYISLMKSIFAELGIKVVGFISSVFAEGLYLFDPELRDRYVLYADVGYITTSVALLRGNGLLFMSSFSMGGAYISSDLSQCLRISFSEAQRLKNKIVLAWQPEKNDTYVVEGGETMATYAAKATNEIATDRVELICEYISKCLDMCPFDIPDFLPLHLTGGGFSTMRGIRNVMSKKLKRQVLRAVPRSLQSARPYNTSEEGLLYLVLNSENSLENIILKV